MKKYKRIKDVMEITSTEDDEENDDDENYVPYNF